MKTKIILGTFIAIFFTNILSFASTFEVIEGKYVQKNYASKKDKTLWASGNFLIVKSIGICWKTEKPIKYKTVMTDKEVFQVNEKGEKKTLTKRTSPYFETVSEITKSIFVSDKKTLAKYFTEKEITDKIYIYEPIEKNIKEIIKGVELHFDENMQIKNVKLLYINGDITEYELTAERTSNTVTNGEKEHFEKK